MRSGLDPQQHSTRVIFLVSSVATRSPIVTPRYVAAAEYHTTAYRYPLPLSWVAFAWAVGGCWRTADFRGLSLAVAVARTDGTSMQQYIVPYGVPLKRRHAHRIHIRRPQVRACGIGIEGLVDMAVICFAYPSHTV